MHSFIKQELGTKLDKVTQGLRVCLMILKAAESNGAEGKWGAGMERCESSPTAGWKLSSRKLRGAQARGRRG